MFQLASLFVEIHASSSGFDRAMDNIHGRLSMANVAMGSFAGNIASSFAGMIIHGAEKLFEGTIGSAAHLGESINKVKVMMGDSAGKIIADADMMADRYGAVKKEVIDASVSFALLGREMKMGGAESAELGRKLTKMALDANSVEDIGIAPMMEKIRAGLAGQSRPLRSLGIFLTAQNVKEEAARMGLKPGPSGQLSEGDKIRARLSFIENSEFMKKAAGDLERTLGSTENATRKFWGTIANLGTSIGQELDPSWNQLLADLNEGMESLKTLFENNKETVRSWGESVVEGFNTATMVWRNLPDIMEIAFLGAQQHLADALAQTELWATKMAVAIEKAFLPAVQKAGDLLTQGQNKTQEMTAVGVGFLESTMKSGQAFAGGVSNIFDAGVGKFAAASDTVLRPLRDVANATGLGMEGPSGKPMSVEEDFNRMKGALSGPGKFMGGIADFFNIYQDVVKESVKANKPKDFTSELIAKADKHLADSLAKNADVSSKGIGEATARITARESAHLDDLANQWVEDTQYDEMFAKKEEWVPATEQFIKDAMNYKKPKEIWGPATEEQLLAEAERNKTRRDAAKKEEEGEEDVLGAKQTHHKAIMDSASYVQELAAKQVGGDVQEKQLTELQLIRAADQKNADMMEKLYNKSAKAAYA